MGYWTAYTDTRGTAGGMEDTAMPAIVEFPTVVQEALTRFGPLFANEPERVHFAEYLTGLLVAQRKNVCGIHNQFLHTTDQSCLNRWLTEVDWDVDRLNQQRLDWLQEDPSTRYSAQGVIPIDNVLVDHAGKLIEDVGWFWDHAEGRTKIAHDYLIVDYVATSGKHYPLEFRRFTKKDQCAERGVEFRDHNVLFRDLVDWVVTHEIPGDFAFDCWFTNNANLEHIDGLGRAYVGDLKFNRKILFAGQEMRAEQLAGQIAPAARKFVEIGHKREWYFTVTLRIPKLGHRVRIVILWDHRHDATPRKILISNRIGWEITRILRVYDRRWAGCECFHRDGKQELGMGDCQCRNGQGQTRHLYMVFLAYSVLMRHLRQGRAHAWALERLKTIGQACRAVMAETFSATISWLLERFEEGWNGQRIKAHLGLT